MARATRTRSPQRAAMPLTAQHELAADPGTVVRALLRGVDAALVAERAPAGPDVGPAGAVRVVPARQRARGAGVARGAVVRRTAALIRWRRGRVAARACGRAARS